VSRSLKVATLVSIAMVALLFAAVQRGRTLRASRVLHQLPSTARAVVRIDTGALESTAAAKKLFEAFIDPEQLSEIEGTCGLDPLASLSEATIWVRGPEDQPLQSIGLMLRGSSVDASTLAECHRRLVEKREGSVVRLEGPAGPFLASRDRQSAIAPLDERTIVTGSVATVAEAMAVQRGTAPALVERSRMAGLWRKVSDASCIAAVLEPPPHWKSALERIAELGDGASAVEGVQGIAFAVQAGSTQTVDVYIDVTDAELAEQDAALIRAWVVSPPRSLDVRWAQVLRSARVRACRSTIVVTLDVSSLSSSR
jgi:hypothetical protein